MQALIAYEPDLDTESEYAPPFEHPSEKSIKLFDDEVPTSMLHSPRDNLQEFATERSDSFVLSEGEQKVVNDFITRITRDPPKKGPWMQKYSASDSERSLERESVKEIEVEEKVQKEVSRSSTLRTSQVK